MASGRRQSDESGSGSGSWLLTGLKIGASIGAIAFGAYAATRANSETERPMRSNCQSSMEEETRKEEQSAPSSLPSAAATSKPARKPSSSLVDDLNDYYTSNIEDSTGKLAAIQSCVEKTADHISSYLTNTHRRLFKEKLILAPFGRLILKQSEEFKLHLPMAFNPEMWKVIKASDTLLKMPGYLCIRRVNLDFLGVGSSPWDTCLVGSYLCPDLVQQYLKKLLEKMIRDGRVLNFYCRVHRRTGSVGLCIENPVGSASDMLYVEIIPYMIVKSASGDSIKALAKSSSSSTSHHVVAGVGSGSSSSSSSGGSSSSSSSSSWSSSSSSSSSSWSSSSSSSSSSSPQDNLWLQSMEESALQQMREFDMDGGCRWKCLAILDALRRSHSPLKIFSLYDLMTVLLRVCLDETEWDNEMIAERFVDLLKAFEGFLGAGRLVDCFDEEVNVLARFSPKIIAETNKWLVFMLASKNGITDLLYN